MKTIFNWRICIRYTLFTIGFMCIALASGEDDSPVAEWLVLHLGLFALGMGAFALLAVLENKWGSN